MARRMLFVAGIACPTSRAAMVRTSAAREDKLVLTILRHGETEWNVQGRLQGSGDSPLTERGVEQARLCGERLRDVQFTAAYCSPLPRARRTADLVLAQLTAPPPLTEVDALKERNFGAWEGLVWSEVERQFAEQLAQARDDADYRMPGGGESRRETLARALAFLERVAETHSGAANVLCVTHSATATALVKEVLGLSQEARRSFEIRNLAINEIVYSAGSGWMLRTLGDCAHLEGAPPVSHGGAQAQPTRPAT